jgi:hypothetical protein
MFFKICAIAAGFLTLLLAYMTLTVPMVSATAPAILMIMFAGITYLFWKKSRQPH